MPPVIIAVSIMPVSPGNDDDIGPGTQYPAAWHPNPSRSAPRPVTVGPNVIRARPLRDNFDLRTGLAWRGRRGVSATRCSNDYRLLRLCICLKISDDFYSRLIPGNGDRHVRARHRISNRGIWGRKRGVGLLNNRGRGNNRTRRRSWGRRGNWKYLGLPGRFSAPCYEENHACKGQNRRIANYHPPEI
jgi:hypothetical protein